MLASGLYFASFRSRRVPDALLWTFNIQHEGRLIVGLYFLIRKDLIYTKHKEDIENMLDQVVRAEFERRGYGQKGLLSSEEPWVCAFSLLLNCTLKAKFNRNRDRKTIIMDPKIVVLILFTLFMYEFLFHF